MHRRVAAVLVSFLFAGFAVAGCSGSSSSVASASNGKLTACGLVGSGEASNLLGVLPPSPPLTPQPSGSGQCAYHGPRGRSLTVQLLPTSSSSVAVANATQLTVSGVTASWFQAGGALSSSQQNLSGISGGLLEFVDKGYLVELDVLGFPEAQAQSIATQAMTAVIGKL